MSDKRIPTKRIVVDASVASTTSGHASQHPAGTLCREFLIRLLSVGHRLAMNTVLREEWGKHGSVCALSWLTAMQSIGKIESVADDVAVELAEVIATGHSDPGVVAAMTKDTHLLAAALAADLRISALDEKVRGHFSQHLRQRPEVMSIIWVNPANEGEAAVAWVDDGAPADTFRRLDKYSTS